eukprot:1806434-Prymnesium_polylepis.1
MSECPPCAGHRRGDRPPYRLHAVSPPCRLSGATVGAPSPSRLTGASSWPHHIRRHHCEEMWGVVGSCRELWGVVGSCGELWGVVGSCGELWGVVESCGEL